MPRAEHVSMESDLSETRPKAEPSRPLMQYLFNKRGRGGTRRVSVLPDQHVAVEMLRSRSAVDMHTVDLRFVDPRPIAVRKVAWPVLYVALGLTLLTAIATLLYAKAPGVAQKIGGLYTPVGLGVAAVLAYVLFYRLTTESLIFLSNNGRARFIVIAGRFGTMRRARPCAAAIVTHINIANKKFRQERQAYLRDEMREHARLHERGVLSADRYNEAKRRILKAHT